MRGARTWATAMAIGAVATFIVSCAPRRLPDRVAIISPSAAITTDTAAATLETRDRIAWIALAVGAPAAPVSGIGAFEVLEQGGTRLLVRGTGGEAWRIERQGQSMRLAGGRGDATPWRQGPFVLRVRNRGAVVLHDGKRYRGELWVSASNAGLLVVNRLSVEDYLRGVVPLELGTRAPGDAAALQAQAIAARSYAYMRVPSAESVPAAGYHMTATVQHQVYGGVSAEHPVVDNAIAATSGLVLRYNGAVVDGPYSSSCGGQSAQPSEVWRGGSDQGYLQSVSDVDPRTGRAFCDISPRHTWEVTYDEPLLRQAIVRHLGSRGASGMTAPQVESVAVGRRTASGRVGTLVLRTDRGTVTMDGYDIRSAFRDARGAILFSTYFQVDKQTRVGERVSGVVLRGSGNGHGVGMCQWGAIGRARAGHDARAILRHYYPGTVVGFAE